MAANEDIRRQAWTIFTGRIEYIQHFLTLGEIRQKTTTSAHTPKSARLLRRKPCRNPCKTSVSLPQFLPVWQHRQTCGRTMFCPPDFDPPPPIPIFKFRADFRSTQLDRADAPFHALVGREMHIIDGTVLTNRQKRPTGRYWRGKCGQNINQVAKG